MLITFHNRYNLLTKFENARKQTKSGSERGHTRGLFFFFFNFGSFPNAICKLWAQKLDFRGPRLRIGVLGRPLVKLLKSQCTIKMQLPKADMLHFPLESIQNEYSGSFLN